MGATLRNGPRQRPWRETSEPRLRQAKERECSAPGLHEVLGGGVNSGGLGLGHVPGALQGVTHLLLVRQLDALLQHLAERRPPVQPCTHHIALTTLQQ